MMSEKSKGDTSRIVKNPLFSASVTGLTFDDFSNKPLLLPAAPPVIAATPVAIAHESTEEKAQSVTVGQKPDIDTETLSEINLNTTNYDDLTGSQFDQRSSSISFENQGNPGSTDESILSQAASSFSQLPTVASTVFSTFSKVIKDYTPSGGNSYTGDSSVQQTARENNKESFFTELSPPPLAQHQVHQHQTIVSDNPSLLISPSSSSFTGPVPQLFSQPTTSSSNEHSHFGQQWHKSHQRQQQLITTDSTASSSLEGIQPQFQQQSIQQQSIQQQEQQRFAQNPTPPQLSERQGEPAKFFSPTEFSNITGPSNINPPLPPVQSQSISGGSQNTYRLSAKKKTYAQIPGLTAHHPTTSLNQSSLFAPFEAGNQQKQPQEQISSNIFTPPLPPTTITSSYDPSEGNYNPSVSVESDISTLPLPKPNIEYQEDKTKQQQSRGLFSFTNLVSPVLQNLSGLVQSTTGQVKAQTTKEEDFRNNQIGDYFNIPVQSQQPYIAPELTLPPPPPPASQIFIPEASGIHSATQQPPLTQTPISGGASSSAGSRKTSLIEPGNSALNLSATSSQSQVSVQQSSESREVQQSTVLYPPPQNSSNYFVQPPLSNTPSAFQTNTVGPETRPPLLKPPSGQTNALGNNTFRLQKGTRHYRSPFTATSSGTQLSGFPPQTQQSSDFPLQQSVFSPQLPQPSGFPLQSAQPPGLPAQIPQQTNFPPQVPQEPIPSSLIPQQQQDSVTSHFDSTTSASSVPFYNPFAASSLNPPEVQSQQLTNSLVQPSLYSVDNTQSEKSDNSQETSKVSADFGATSTEAKDNSEESVVRPPSPLSAQIDKFSEQIQNSFTLSGESQTPSNNQFEFQTKSQDIAEENKQNNNISPSTTYLENLKSFDNTAHQLTRPPPESQEGRVENPLSRTEASIVNETSIFQSSQPQLNRDENKTNSESFQKFPFSTPITQSGGPVINEEVSGHLQSFFPTSSQAFVETGKDIHPITTGHKDLPQPQPIPTETQRKDNSQLDSNFNLTSYFSAGNNNFQSPYSFDLTSSTLKRPFDSNSNELTRIPTESVHESEANNNIVSQPQQAINFFSSPASDNSTGLFREGFESNLKKIESKTIFSPIEYNKPLETQSEELKQQIYLQQQKQEQLQQEQLKQEQFKQEQLKQEQLQQQQFQQQQLQQQQLQQQQFQQQQLQQQQLQKQEQQIIQTPLPDPLAFFDSFSQSTGDLIRSDTATASDRDTSKISDANKLKIQDFFNNPPQAQLNESGSDLNYKLVGRGVSNDQLIENPISPASESGGAASPISNIVEPPSSSCSEFSSEFTTQLIGNLSKLTSDDLPDELLEEFKMAGILGGTSSSQVYQPVKRHWFYKKSVDNKHIWTPFSYYDSNALEEAFLSGQTKIVAVEGGRYDVNIAERTRSPVYWSDDSSEVKRCSWFYKAVDSKYVPYEEAIADLLEEEYKESSFSGEWHKKVALPTGETVVFHGPTVMVHFLQTSAPSADSVWGGTSTQSTPRPRVVKRDIEDFSIDQGESSKVDHLIFMIHGIGSVCDFKFRPLEEVVDEFRSIAFQLVQSHYKNSCDNETVGRIEVLPVSWHSQLHSGIDDKLKAITLESIPKLRNFTNDTLLDILFYTSPIYCQGIMNTVSEAMNRIYMKYCQRNPKFTGGVSLAGHSLGSLILFDLLCHQKPLEEAETLNSENPDQMVQPLKFNQNLDNSELPTTSKQISYTIGSAGTGQPSINYPQLVFHPKKFFALGSPIGMFVTIRGIDTLGLDFKLPTCSNFYNIFHPYDPVAYRIEALVNTDLSGVRPVLIPHHKGRKRMHLELKETMARVGADLKQKIVDTCKNAFESVYFLSSKSKPADAKEIEKEVDKVLDMQLKLDQPPSPPDFSAPPPPRSRTSSSTSALSDIDSGEIDIPLGKLNNSKRIDYVLQEAPLEFFNEYLFALTAHVCYWESADTILFVIKEIYSSLGVNPDSQIPQQTMTIERPSSRASQSSSSPSKGN